MFKVCQFVKGFGELVGIQGYRVFDLKYSFGCLELFLLSLVWYS